jgi:hypothetical protein
MQISRHWRLNSQRYRLEGLKLDESESASNRATDTQEVEQVPQTASAKSKRRAAAVTAA